MMLKVNEILLMIRGNRERFSYFKNWKSRRAS